MFLCIQPAAWRSPDAGPVWLQRQTVCCMMWQTLLHNRTSILADSQCYDWFVYTVFNDKLALAHPVCMCVCVCVCNIPIKLIETGLLLVTYSAGTVAYFAFIFDFFFLTFFFLPFFSALIVFLGLLLQLRQTRLCLLKLQISDLKLEYTGSRYKKWIKMGGG